jgi:hypothetical protein
MARRKRIKRGAVPPAPSPAIKKRAAAKPKKPYSPALLDFGPSYDVPDYDRVSLIRTTMLQRLNGGGLLIKLGSRWSVDDPRVNLELQSALMDLGVTLASLGAFTLDGDWAESSDGQFHCDVAIDPANPTHYSIHLQYPATALIGGTGTGSPAAFNSPALLTDPLTIGPSVSMTGTGTPTDPYHLTFRNLRGADGTNGTTPVFNTPALIVDPLTTGAAVSMTGTGTPTDPYHITFRNLQGADGATGAAGTNGTNGTTPVFNTPALIVDPLTTGAAVSMTGTGTPTDPYHITFRNLQGADGIPGAAPIFNSPAAIPLAAGSEPTVALSGVGTDVNPIHLSFGIPRGADGTIIGTSPTSSSLPYTDTPLVELVGAGTSAEPYQFNIGIPQGRPGAQGVPGDSSLTPPTLPLPGGAPVTFDIEIFASGGTLPFLLPAGYSIAFTPFSGVWGLETGASILTTATIYNPSNMDIIVTSPGQYRGRLSAVLLSNPTTFPPEEIFLPSLVLGPYPDDYYVYLGESAGDLGAAHYVLPVSGVEAFGSILCHATITPKTIINITLSTWADTGVATTIDNPTPHVGETFTISASFTGLPGAGFGWQSTMPIGIEWISFTGISYHYATADTGEWLNYPGTPTFYQAGYLTVNASMLERFGINTLTPGTATFRRIS